MTLENASSAQHTRNQISSKKNASCQNAWQIKGLLSREDVRLASHIQESRSIFSIAKDLNVLKNRGFPLTASA